MTAPVLAVVPGASTSRRHGPCHEELSPYTGGGGIGAEGVGCDHVRCLSRRRDAADTRMPPASRCDADPSQGRTVARSRRQRQRVAWSSGALTAVSVAAAVLARCSPAPAAAFAVVPRLASCQPSSPLTAVHKRSGNRDLSARTAASVAARTMEAAVAPPPARRRKANVFEQFSPDYLASPYDVDIPSDDGFENGFVAGKPRAADGAQAPRRGATRDHAINRRLRTLLKDDTGEQEGELYPDHSPEAAAQLAEPKSYGKLSEEARRKANLAVKSGEVDDEVEADEEGHEDRAAGARKRRARAAAGARRRDDGSGFAPSPHGVTLAPSQRAAPRRRLRATVKETGVDSISTYIKSLGQHELLFQEDEVLLGRQVRLLGALEEKRQVLEGELLRPPTFALWAAATNHTVPSLKQQIRRSQRAKAALIAANLRLVITVARQATKRSPGSQSKAATAVLFQDACQQGVVGLTRAAEKFDPEKGFRFSTYAVWWIQKEVAKNVSEQSRTVRVPPSALQKINAIRIQERVLMAENKGRRPSDEELAARVGMSVKWLNIYRRSAKEVSSLDRQVDARTGKGSMASGGDSGDGATMDVFVQDTELPGPSELANQQMLQDDVRRLVRTLSPREQAVIRLRFGLDDGKPWGLEDIAKKFGAEKKLVKEIEARALKKLRQPSRSGVVQCYVSDHT